MKLKFHLVFCNNCLEGIVFDKLLFFLWYFHSFGPAIFMKVFMQLILISHGYFHSIFHLKIPFI